MAQRTVLDDLFEASFDRLFGEGVGLTTQTDAFFESFYGRFLERPEVAALFEAVDLERQSQMLRQSFFKLLTVHLTNDWSKELERVAALHEHLAVDPELYDRWLDDVLETVAEHDEGADARVLLAWRLALQPGITCFRHWQALGTPDH